MKVEILGVKIDDINLATALAMTEKWIQDRDKHYIVTPNLEFILSAQEDREFKRILNNADLAIPDSSSLGFSYWLLRKSFLIRLLLWPFYFSPFKQVIQFNRVSGTEFMEALCQLAKEKGFTIGLLGGEEGVAIKSSECLMRKYPNLKISYVSSGGIIDSDGNSHNTQYIIPATDILFVAFGHIKQEKWIAYNLNKIPVKIAIGVGGAFDYISGRIPRASKWIRDLGFEWLFRLIIQPRRIKRQLALLKLIIWILLSQKHF